MRVLHVGIASPTQASGGLNRYVAELSRAQSANGVDTVVLALGDQPADTGFVFVARQTDSILRRFRGFRSGVRDRRSSSSVIDVHFAWNALSFLAARIGRLPPIVMHFHGPWAAEAASDGERRAAVFVKRCIESWTYRRVAGFIVLTDAFKRLLVRDYGIPDSKVVVIPPGVDTDRFAPGDRAAARRRLGLPEQSRIVVAVRRLVPRMGLADLVIAMADIDATLVIVGSGPLRAELERTAMEAGSADRVRIVSDVSDVDLPDYYRAADLSAIPTRELEGFGLVALESLASGTPVVARAQGGLVDALAGFDERSLLSDRSVPALRQRIQELLDSPVPQEECVAFAARSSWSNVAVVTEQFYDSLVRAS